MSMQPYGPFPPQHPANYRHPTDQRTNTVEVVFAWIITVGTVGYMLPWAIAATRGKANSVAIAVVNFFAGWTLIGWLASLIMACSAHQMAQAPVFVHNQASTFIVTPAGWYPAPDRQGQRYWDGNVWTSHTSP